jgi:2-polyprenyl-6-methoxyphenol hydroxylase-like FAD-dependent oxidoreductase
METRWDVIIVGARCSGATLAALLARQGLRTLLLEASPRGTDMPLSTHMVQAAGMDVLDRIGVGDRVRRVAPPLLTFRFALDDSLVLAKPDAGRYSYCVRRSIIDPWLQNAAETAGATFLDRHRVLDLVRAGDRICGVVARTPSGRVTFQGDLVIGADGMHSTVAKLAQVEEYYVGESTRAGYWAYFPAPSKWTEPWDAALEHQGDDLRYVFRTDNDLLTLVYVGTAQRVQAWGSNRREQFLAALGRSETTRKLCEGKAPLGQMRGLMRARFFYRRPVGPGFALAGDAGHFKDFVTGLGMSDAFLDAQRLARTVLDGRAEAFDVYWRERDAETLPLHFDAIAQGTVGFNSPFNRWVIGRVGKDPEMARRVPRMIDRKIDPADLVPPRKLLGWMGLALLGGRFDVLSGCLQAGKQRAAEHQEIAERRALCQQAKATLATAAVVPARDSSLATMTPNQADATPQPSPVSVAD